VNLGAPTALALGRALIIAGLAVAVAAWLSGWLAAQRGRRRTFAWALLLAPFFTPPLLISYAFSKFALALVAAPWSHEALYIGVLALKLTPVAVIVRRLVPPPLSAPAWHVYRMLGIASWRERVLFRLRGAGRSPWLAAGVVFLLAFADFELASLWSVKTWTVAIFDAQIGGLALGETLRLAAIPLAVQIALLALGAWNRHDFAAVALREERSASRAAWTYLIASSLLICAVPLGIVSAQAVSGWRTLSAHFILTREIGASVFFALAAALLADLGARLGRRRRAAVLLAVPGLLGALVVALLVLALFQRPALRPAYDTPLPLILALALGLLPLAFMLRALTPRTTPALHLARQTGSRRVLWPLQTRPRVIAFGALFYWAYFDFTASSILAPVGFTPVFVRLHNLAHYGQTDALSAMMLAAFAVPILTVLLAGAVARFTAGRR